VTWSNTKYIFRLPSRIVRLFESKRNSALKEPRAKLRDGSHSVSCLYASVEMLQFYVCLLFNTCLIFLRIRINVTRSS